MGNGEQFRADHALGSTRLVDMKVRGVCADNGAPWSLQGGEREHVATGSVPYEQRLDVPSEEFIEGQTGSSRERVVAVGERVARVRPGECLEDEGMGARGVI